VRRSASTSLDADGDNTFISYGKHHIFILDRPCLMKVLGKNDLMAMVW